ncbi:MAG TPA: hypothetical protein DDY72_04305 [Verrucomicrobia bacterium]|nr:hypothetical protein [Verrucomicrobiota bacterium]
MKTSERDAETPSGREETGPGAHPPRREEEENARGEGRASILKEADSLQKVLGFPGFEKANVEIDGLRMQQKCRDMWCRDPALFFAMYENECEVRLGLLNHCRGLADACTLPELDKTAVASMISTLQSHIESFFEYEVEADIDKMESFLNEHALTLGLRHFDASRGREAFGRLLSLLSKARDLPEKDQRELEEQCKKRTDKARKAFEEAGEQGESQLPILSAYVQDLAWIYEKRVDEVFQDEKAKAKTQAAYAAEFLRPVLNAGTESVRKDIGEMKAEVKSTRCDLQNFTEAQDRDHKQFGTLAVNIAQSVSEIKSNQPKATKKHKYGVTLDNAVLIMKRICGSDAVCKRTLKRWFEAGQSLATGMPLKADHLASETVWSAWCKSYFAEMTNRLKVKRYLDERRQARK